MRCPIFLVTICLLLIAVFATAPYAAPAPQFPLVKGTYWLYQGTVKWEDGKKIETRTITQKMEITEVIKREHVTAAVVKGSTIKGPKDARYAMRYLIVQVGPSLVYFLHHQRMTKALKQLRDPKDALVELLSDNELYLDLPLVKGKVFGETDQIARQDGDFSSHRWIWIVTNATSYKAAGVKGISAKTPRTEYRLQFRTNPDATYLDFVPGVGVTGYHYKHHGAIEEQQFRLVEYHEGK